MRTDRWSWSQDHTSCPEAQRNCRNEPTKRVSHVDLIVDYVLSLRPERRINGQWSDRSRLSRSTQISGPLTLGAGGFWVSLPLCRAVVFVFVSQSIFRRNQKKKDIFGIGTASSRPKMCVEWSGRRRTRRIRDEKKESIKPFWNGITHQLIIPVPEMNA